MRILHPASFCHGQWFAIANDEVIEHTYIDQRQRVFQALGQVAVGLAGFGNAGGMIVGQNQRC